MCGGGVPRDERRRAVPALRDSHGCGARPELLQQQNAVIVGEVLTRDHTPRGMREKVQSWVQTPYLVMSSMLGQAQRGWRQHWHSHLKTAGVCLSSSSHTPTYTLYTGLCTHSAAAGHAIICTLMTVPTVHWCHGCRAVAGHSRGPAAAGAPCGCGPVHRSARAGSGHAIPLRRGDLF